MKKNKGLFLALLSIVFIFSFAGYFGSDKSSAVSKESHISVDPKLEGYVKELNKMAKKEPKIDKLINNIEDYPNDIVKLVANNPETTDFALDYPKNKNSSRRIDISSSYNKGSIPHFIQWDKQWGYSKYGEKIIAVNGCGPTCLSMVAVGLTGDKSLNPKKVAEYSYNNGYMDSNSNTKWSLMKEGAKELGLNSRQVALDKNVIKSELKEGHPVILSVKKGDFTKEGHFIVLKGIAGDGKIQVNDPNSNIRSEKTWDIERLIKQSKAAWAFSSI